jgi:integrase
MSDEPKKKRRRPGTGQIITRGENKHLIAIFRGYKPNGTNDYFYKTFHGPKKEAERWLREALVRRDRGEPLEDPDIGFETLFNEWMDSKKRKPKTIEIYNDNYNYYIKPRFGASKISAITSRDVQKWVNELHKTLSGTSVHLAYSVFRTCIRYALDHEMLLKSPIKAVELPPKEKRKPNVLEPTEALKVLEACKTEPGGIFVAFLLWAGTRPNEAAALQWEDVDWKSNGVEIRRTIVRLRGGKWDFGEPKTENGKRSFTMPASFMQWLNEHRKAQLEQKLALGRDWYDYDLVFPNEVGEPISSTSYLYLWRRVLAAAGLSYARTKMRPYDARHSMATLLLGHMPVKVVSKRLGHRDTGITENVYSHVLDSVQEQATDVLEQVILKGKKL